VVGRSLLSRLARDRRGVGAVEFGIIGAAFFTLLLLAFEMAWQMAVAAGLDQGARQAARWVATGAAPPNGSTREAEVLRRISQSSGLPIDVTRLTVATDSFTTLGSINTPIAATPGIGNAEAIVRYRVTYRAAALTPAARMLLPLGEVSHAFTVLARNEPYASP
jgi:Flp pilus assembly protein TadG